MIYWTISVPNFY